MSPSLLIAAKDLRQRVRDASAIVMAIILPVALAAVLSLILGGTADEGMSFQYAVVDLDRGVLAQTFREAVLEEVEREGLIALVPADSTAAARDLIRGGEVQAAFVVPSGFTVGVQEGETPPLEVVGDVDEPLATDIATSLADGYAQLLNGVRLGVATVLHTSDHEPDRAAMASLTERASRMASSVALDDIAATRRELDSNTYFAAGMAVFFVFFTVQFGVSSILEERKDGTLSRLLAAPIGRAAILTGKLLGAFLLGVISMTILILSTAVLLGARWGNPVGVGLLVVAGVLSALAIMALVATLAKTAEQAGSWQAVLALVLGMFGGSFFPLSQAGGLFAKLSLLTPHAWFIRGLSELAGGAGPAAVLPSVAAMLTFAVVTGSVAVARLGRFTQP